MSPLDNQDPLTQLNDIIAPTAPNWFPPALIYWLLFALTIVIIVASYSFFKKYQSQQKLRKSQLNKLAQLQQQKIDFIALNQLLKGCALSYLARSEVASLHGEQWFDFLQKYSDITIFKNKKEFMQRLYQSNNSPTDESDFIDAKKWITALPKQIKKAQKDV